MAFQVSPGVVVQEVDNTTIIPNVSTSIGGVVINSTQGPVDHVVELSSENELVEIFGKPTSGTASSWFSAANFLKYSGALKVVRAIDETTAKNSSGSAGVYIPNGSIWEDAQPSAVGLWAARTPGVWGDTLKVEMCTSATAFATWAYKDRFDSAPGTSEYATAQGGSDDEMHIVVIDEAGKITGTAGTVLEDFAFLSKASDARSVTGVNNYYKDVIFRSSNYIYWMEHQLLLLDGTTTITPAFGSASSSTFLTTTEVYPLSLAGGVDGSPGDSDFVRGWDLFEDADTVDVNLLIAGPGDATHAQNVMDIADGRKDCVAFISPESSDVVGVSSSATQTTNIKTFFDTLNSSSYSVFDSGWKKQYDPYNDNDVWVPLNGDMAGLCANTDDVADPWFSPAGESRGNVKSVIKLAFNPTKTQRDTLYKARINPVCTFPGKGTVLWGDKTAQSKASAFDRINVRRLFIVLEKAIAKASESQLFELNDDITRANFRAMVEPFLRDVQGRRGITDFKVVCDTTNNTGDVIDRNEFRGDIYIKPTRSINFIQLRFIATRTGDSFDEIGG
jgi:hypothetical protein